MVDVTQAEEKLNLLLQLLTEIFQVNVSIWRIIYALFEIFALLFIFLILPVWIGKLIKWAINEIFKKK